MPHRRLLGAGGSDHPLPRLRPHRPARSLHPRLPLCRLDPQGDEDGLSRLSPSLAQPPLCNKGPAVAAGVGTAQGLARLFRAKPRPTSCPAPATPAPSASGPGVVPRARAHPRAGTAAGPPWALAAAPSRPVLPRLSQVPEKPAGAVLEDVGLRLHASQRVAALRVPQQPAGRDRTGGCSAGIPGLPPCSRPPAPHSPCRHPPGPQHPVQLQRLCGADAPVPGAHAQQHRRLHLWHSQRWVPGTLHLAPHTHPAPLLPGPPGRWASAAAWRPPPRRGAPARRSRAAPGRRSACGTEVLVGAVRTWHGTARDGGVALTSRGCRRCPVARAGWRRGCAGRRLGSAQARG